MTENTKDSRELRRESTFDSCDQAWHDRAYAFSEGYRRFLDLSRTERECVASFAKMAVEHGFIEHVAGESPADAPGQLFISRGKAVALYRPGRRPAAEGVNVVISHVDSPRLDLKVNPLYEEQSVGLLKTHYYGGIRKHQWLSRPLALHGVIVKQDGTEIDLRLGSAPEDPVFVVSDLLPHLAHKVQNTKKVTEFYPGEKLNLICGLIPVDDQETKNRVKAAVLEHLHQTYGIVEEDFVSAEIEAVPAAGSRDVGFDRAVLGAYGQDDRVCAYSGVRALLEAESLERGALAVAVDKEEIGSAGATGAQSAFLENVLAEVLALEGVESELALRRLNVRSSVLSADVCPAIHPDWAEVHEKNNAARLGHGLVLVKYTGARGKAGANDADAEYLARLRRLLNQADVPWQTGGLGKIDEGGGGTVAKFLAAHGMNVIDAGPPLLGMHSPFELVAKADVYATYLGYQAFFETF